MRTTPRTLVAFATSAALLAFAGCGDEEKPPPPDATPTEQVKSPSATTSTADAAPVEPELPDAATQPTEDGARAFITYYWDLINYAQATGDVTALKASSAKTCAGCTGLAKDLQDLYKSGGRLVGGTNSVKVTTSEKLTTPRADGYAFKLKQEITYTEQTVVKGDGSEEQNAAGTRTFTTYVLWLSQGRWRTDVFEVQ